MRYFVCFLFLVCQVGNSFTDEIVTNLHFSESELSFTREKGFDVAKMEGCVFTSEPGKPQLPMKCIFLAIPAGTKVVSVAAKDYEVGDIDGRYNIMPAQELVFIGEKSKWNEPDLTTYNCSTPYPGKLVEYVNEGYMAGYKIVNLQVYPVQYIPDPKDIKLYTDMEIVVEYEFSSDVSVQAERMSKENREFFKSLIENLVVNRPDVLRYSPNLDIVETESVSPFYVSEFPTLSEGTAIECVIITSNELADTFQVLADWKTRKGVPTTTKNVSWITANYQGRDGAEKIRNFIRDAFTNWGTIWILLGGDTDILPVRYARVVGPSRVCDIPTELYYSCLDGNWDADGDGIFGESQVDSVDLYPEVFVGRLPVHTPSEAGLMIDKLSAYRSPSYSPATALFLGPNMAYECDGKFFCNLVADRWWWPQDFTRVKLYECEGTQDRETVIDSLNKGFGIVYSQGHGDETVMQVGEYRVDWLYRSDVSQLTNSDMYSIWYAISCYAADFSQDCMAEHFLLNPEGGGVAWIGSSVNDGPIPSDEFDYYFFDRLFCHDKFKTGQTLACSKISTIGMAEHYAYIRMLQFGKNLLGDPEMAIWTEKPDTLVVTHPTQVGLGHGKFEVKVKDIDGDAASSVPDALVCLKKGNEDYAYGLTDSQGVITFDFTPESEGEMSVTVTKHNYIPYEGSASVVADGPYLKYVGPYYVDDDTLGGSSGNGNGIVDAGETIELRLNLDNTGTMTVYEVVMKLRTDDSYITLIDSVEYDDAINPWDPLMYPPAYRFAFITSASCPDEHKVNFTIAITGQYYPRPGMLKKYSSTDTLSIDVAAPMLIHLSHIIDDDSIPPSSGDGDGIVELGEMVELPLTIRNVGSGVAMGVNAKLRSDDCSIVDSTEVFEDIPPDSEVTCEESVFLFGPVENKGMWLSLIISDSYERETTYNFNLNRPTSPANLSSEPGLSFIDLSWTPVSDADLWGYNLYRKKSDESSFLRVNPLPIEGASYRDEGVDESYYYYVVALDTSANESFGLDTIAAWTCVDYQLGWPIQVVEKVNDVSPTLADIDQDGDLEVLIGTLTGPTCHLYGWHNTGEGFWPDGILAETQGWLTTPAVGDIDDDGEPEIVAAGGDTLFAWKRDGSVLFQLPTHWPTLSAPCLEDVNNDGFLEITVVSFGGWQSVDSSKVHLFGYQGSSGWCEMPGWPYTMTGGSSFGTPAIAELDIIAQPKRQEGYKEILVGGYNGILYCFNYDGTVRWTFDAGGSINSSPAIGNIDGDPYDSLEMVFASLNNKLWVLSRNGAEMPGWENGKDVLLVSLYGKTSSPALGDVDGDNYLEVVIGGRDSVWVFEDDGTRKQNWPVFRKNDYWWNHGTPSSPVLADVDGDGEIDILIGGVDPTTRTGLIYAWHSGGTPVVGWPTRTESPVFSTPSIADLDCDSSLEVVASDRDGKIYVWDSDIPSTAEIEWGTFHHDAWHTGVYGKQIPAFRKYTSVDHTDTKSIRSYLCQNYPNPFREKTKIYFSCSATTKVSLKVYDSAGRLVRVLCNGPKEPGHYSISWDGSTQNGGLAASGVYFYRLEAGDYKAVRKLVRLR